MMNIRFLSAGVISLLTALAVNAPAGAEKTTGREYVVDNDTLKAPTTVNSGASAQNKYPSWITWKITKRTYNIGRKCFILDIQHFNNSKDRVITAIFDKTLKVRLSYKNGNVKYTLSHEIINANSTEVSPGESVTIRYEIPITAEMIDWLNETQGDKSGVTYSFQVKHKEI